MGTAENGEHSPACGIAAKRPKVTRDAPLETDVINYLRDCAVPKTWREILAELALTLGGGGGGGWESLNLRLSGLN